MGSSSKQEKQIFVLSHEYGSVAFLMTPLRELRLGQENCYWVMRSTIASEGTSGSLLGLVMPMVFKTLSVIRRYCLGASTRGKEDIKQTGHSLSPSISHSSALCSVLLIFFYLRFYEKEGFYCS